MKIIALALFALISSKVHAGADYSKCADFFNNDAGKEENPRGYRAKYSGPFVPTRWRYVPFDLEHDGQLTVDEGVEKSVEHDHAGRIVREIMTYSSPSLESLETLGTAELRPEIHGVKVVVERNSRGNITAITENVGLVTDEDSEIDRIEAWNEGDEELAFAYRATRTEFKVTAGECVPMKSKELVVIYRDDKRQEVEIVIFDTELCRRIEEFFSRNPRARSAFDKDLNSKMVEIFAASAKGLIAPKDMEKEFLTIQKIDELTNEPLRPTFSSHELKIQVMQGYAVGTQLNILGQMKSGTSPVISANMILGRCHLEDLAAFFRDSKYWNEALDGF